MKIKKLNRQTLQTVTLQTVTESENWQLLNQRIIDLRAFCLLPLYRRSDQCRTYKLYITLHEKVSLLNFRFICRVSTGHWTSQDFHVPRKENSPGSTQLVPSALIGSPSTPQPAPKDRLRVFIFDIYLCCCVQTNEKHGTFLISQ